MRSPPPEKWAWARSRAKEAWSVLRWQVALHIFDARPDPGHLCAGKRFAFQSGPCSQAAHLSGEPTSRSPRTKDPVRRRRYRLLLVLPLAVASMSLKKTSVFLCTPTNFRHASLPVL